jgi:hypothetical protein
MSQSSGSKEETHGKQSNNNMQQENLLTHNFSISQFLFLSNSNNLAISSTDNRTNRENIGRAYKS